MSNVRTQLTRLAATAIAATVILAALPAIAQNAPAMSWKDLLDKADVHSRHQSGIPSELSGGTIEGIPTHPVQVLKCNSAFVCKKGKISW
jgi:hypothetical protein